MIDRRKLIALGALLPIACAPQSAAACSLERRLPEQMARNIVSRLMDAWWRRDRDAFAGQLLDGESRDRVLALYERYFASPAEQRELGNFLVRGNVCIFEVIEAGTDRKSGICDGYPSALLFKLSFSGTRGGVDDLSLIDEVLFVPDEWRRGDPQQRNENDGH